MTASPTLPDVSGVNQNNPKVRLIAVILILACVAVAALAIFLLVPRRPKMPPIDLTKINYSSPLEKESFLKNFDAAKKERQKDKRYKLLEESFSYLRGFYIGSHDAATREQAQIFAAFMTWEFPDNYQKTQTLYTIPCIDATCGTANYPEPIKSLKTSFEDISAIDKQVLESIMKKFEAAAISTDAQVQWSNYFDAYLSLKSEFVRTKDDKVAEAQKSLEDFLRESYPQNFKVFEKYFKEDFSLGG